MSTYTGVTNCEKQSGFWPTLYISVKKYVSKSVEYRATNAARRHAVWSRAELSGCVARDCVVESFSARTCWQHMPSVGCRRIWPHAAIIRHRLWCHPSRRYPLTLFSRVTGEGVQLLSVSATFSPMLIWRDVWKTAPPRISELRQTGAHSRCAHLCRKWFCMYFSSVVVWQRMSKCGGGSTHWT